MDHRGASFSPGADMRRPSLGQLRHYLWRRSTWNMPLAVRQRLILAAYRRQTPRFSSEMASRLWDRNRLQPWGLTLPGSKKRGIDKTQRSGAVKERRSAEEAEARGGG